MIELYPKLKSNYIDTGKVFYVYRTFLRGPDDGMAEKLARCMPKDKYLSFTDSLFRNQSRWDYEFGIPSPQGVHAALIQLAGEAGMTRLDATECWIYQHGLRHMGEIEHARALVGLQGMTS